MVESAPALQHRGLLAGTIDIAFTRPVQAAQSALLRSEHIQTEPLYAVVPVTHRLAKKRSIRIGELADDTFVLNDRKHSPVVFDKVITLCAQAEITPRIGATATVGSGVITLVEAGEGVAILPEGSRSLGTDALVFIPLTDSGASVDLVIAWSVQHSNPAVQSFVELIRKRRKKNPAAPSVG
jgi:DNA-binding transcriptional LysR family regulator